MKPYFVRTIKGIPDYDADYAGIYLAENERDLFWLVDCEIDPFVCEFCCDELPPIGLLARVSTEPEDQDDDFPDDPIQRLDFKDCLAEADVAETLSDNKNSLCWVSFMSKFEHSPNL